MKKLVDARRPGVAAVSKVKGHADEGMVRAGKVRELTRLVMNLRIKLPILVVAGLTLGSLIPGELTLVLTEHGTSGSGFTPLFVAMVRVIVEYDGGGALLQTRWFGALGAQVKRRRIIEAVRDSAMSPSPERLWTGGWQSWPAVVVADGNVEHWASWFPP